MTRMITIVNDITINTRVTEGEEEPDEWEGLLVEGVEEEEEEEGEEDESVTGGVFWSSDPTELVGMSAESLVYWSETKEEEEEEGEGEGEEEEEEREEEEEEEGEKEEEEEEEDNR